MVRFYSYKILDRYKLIYSDRKQKGGCLGDTGGSGGGGQGRAITGSGDIGGGDGYLHYLDCRDGFREDSGLRTAQTAYASAIFCMSITSH